MAEYTAYIRHKINKVVQKKKKYLIKWNAIPVCKGYIIHSKKKWYSLVCHVFKFAYLELYQRMIHGNVLKRKHWLSALTDAQSLKRCCHWQPDSVSYFNLCNVLYIRIVFSTVFFLFVQFSGSAFTLHLNQCGPKFRTSLTLMSPLHWVLCIFFTQ